jgi:hypothetical protein
MARIGLVHWGLTRKRRSPPAISGVADEDDEDDEEEEEEDEEEEEELSAEKGERRILTTHTEPMRGSHLSGSLPRSVSASTLTTSPLAQPKKLPFFASCLPSPPPPPPSPNESFAVADSRHSSTVWRKKAELCSRALSNVSGILDRESWLQCASSVNPPAARDLP